MDPKLDPAHADPTAHEGELVAHAERLAVTTTAADGRRVRLRKRIVTQEKQITVTVRREELVVEHLDEQGHPLPEPAPVRGNAAVARGTAAAGEIVLHAEQVEVVTSVVPVERVRVFVDRITTDRQVSDSVAREEIVVEGDTEHRPFTRDPRADGSVGAPL